MVEELFVHRHTEENGDIVDIRIFRVPKSAKQPEGISYALAYISKGKRLVGYDNSEGHENVGTHHKHIRNKILPYDYVDAWRLIEDFNNDIEQLR